MAKRQTIGENPLDGMFSATEDSKSSVAVMEEEQPAPQKKRLPAKKQRITVQISEDVIERVKNAVYWTPGLTVAQLTEEALAYALDRLEEKNRKPFEKRKSELNPGRPVK